MLLQHDVVYDHLVSLNSNDTEHGVIHILMRRVLNDVSQPHTDTTTRIKQMQVEVDVRAFT
jgi:hypothetical protein